MVKYKTDTRLPTKMPPTMAKVPKNFKARG